MMLVGVITFSLATGTVSSIITSDRSEQAILDEKMRTLEIIKKEYDIDRDLFTKLIKAVNYDHN